MTWASRAEALFSPEQDGEAAETASPLPNPHTWGTFTHLPFFTEISTASRTAWHFRPS